MNRTKAIAWVLMLAAAWAVPSPSRAQIFPAFGKGKGLPKISIVKDGLPALANPAYGEILLSGNEALLEPAWLIGALRDAATGQVLKWNNYLLPDAKPNVKLLTDTVFEGFVDSSAAANTEWLSTLKLQAKDQSVAEVVVTRVSVTSVSPKEIDRGRLLQELVQKLPPEQQNRYGVIIAYVDIAITSTRFQHYEVDGDVAGYGGRIGGEWYYKDKQKTTDHRLVAISAPLQFAVTHFASPAGAKPSLRERPCYELVSDAIRDGSLPPERTGLLGVSSSSPLEFCPTAIAASLTPSHHVPVKAAKKSSRAVGKPRPDDDEPGQGEAKWAVAEKSPPRSWMGGSHSIQADPMPGSSLPAAAAMPACAPPAAPPP
jgi:hypothetical protein